MERQGPRPHPAPRALPDGTSGTNIPGELQKVPGSSGGVPVLQESTATPSPPL